MPFDRELEVARAAALEAGGILLRHYQEGTRSWQKGEDDPVTLADLESALDLDDGLDLAWMEMGEIAADRQDLPRALACYQQALRLVPDDDVIRTRTEELRAGVAETGGAESPVTT